MFERYKLKKHLEKEIKKRQQTKDDLISQVLQANFEEQEHNMLVEDEKVFLEISKKTQKELLPLEKADLIDYWKKETNGRTNKKRRNLLRRS